MQKTSGIAKPLFLYAAFIVSAVVGITWNCLNASRQDYWGRHYLFFEVAQNIKLSSLDYHVKTKLGPMLNVGTENICVFSSTENIKLLIKELASEKCIGCVHAKAGRAGFFWADKQFLVRYGIGLYEVFITFTHAFWVN